MTDTNKSRGIKHLINAAGYSFNGLVSAFREETAFRHELMAILLLLPLALWFDVSAVERALMIASLLLVLIVELLNSGIEAAIDRVGMERHVLSGRAKDMGSAAVFLALMLVVLVWGVILL